MCLAENDSIAAVFQGHPPNACATFGQGQQQHDLYYHSKLYIPSSIKTEYCTRLVVLHTPL